MPSTKFDIAIIGAGAAGIHLALAMQRDPWFSGKKVLLLEKSDKDSNDRTWCFWEKGSGQWDKLLRHQWQYGDFYANGDALPLDLTPYRYKMLRGIDFYDYARQILGNSPDFNWVQDEVVGIETGPDIQIRGRASSYAASLVFDSRIPEAFFQADKYTRLLQHFKGWVIRTPDDRFDPSRFNMMDYRLCWPDSTSFTYVLPLNTREALVEFTLFSPALIRDEDYEQMLRRYIGEVLLIRDYEILETEQGVIPMSDFPFENYSNGRHIRIGTAGGWVKPSSGYSFKNCERNSRIILENLKAGRPLNRGVISAKYRFYDSVFLEVLQTHNERGPEIFHAMYLKNDVQQIFKFLDEETSLIEELRIIRSFPIWLFLRAMLRYLLR